MQPVIVQEGESLVKSNALTDSLTPDLSYTRGEISIIVIAACLGWGLEFFDLQLLSLYAPSLMKDFGLSMSVFGALASVQLLGTAFGGVMFGLLADKYGRKRVLTWTVLVFSISTFLVIFTPNAASLFVLRFITGLGTGGEWAIGYSLLIEAWNPKRRGLMGGVVQASIWPAYALAVVVNQFIPNWHWGFCIGLFPALFAIWIRYKCPESKVWLRYNELKLKGELPEEIRNHAKHSTIFQIFQKDMIKYTILGTAIVFGGQYAFYALSQWMPTLLVNTFHTSVNLKSSILYLGSAIALVSYISAGGLSDRYGRKKTFIAFTLLTLVAYIGFSVSSFSNPQLSTIVFWYIVFNFGIGYFGIFGTWFAELFPTRVRATGSSFAYNVGRGMASSAPLIVGLLASNNSLLLGLPTAVIAIFVMLISITFLVERKGRTISSIE